MYVTEESDVNLTNKLRCVDVYNDVDNAKPVNEASSGADVSMPSYSVT